MKPSKNHRGITVFYSYASADKELRDQLANHLIQLKRDELISEWHDQQILAGADRAQIIDQAIHSAHVILLLISPDYLASDVQYYGEMQQAMARHKLGETCIVPILVRPCDWQHSPFAHLQCLPRDGKAITAWPNLDEAFLTIARELRQVIEQQQIALHALPEVERQNRLRLIKRVRQTWIEGVLEQSLHQAALIALDLQEQPDALANPWQMLVQETGRLPYPLPAGTSIVQIYDDADGELLILGEPGSGKTTLLLELARILLQRAEERGREQLPIVFNLSSWAQAHRPLTDWLVEELWTKYQIPRKIGQNWINTDQILPLLDGLDEVAEHVRSACVQAINAYHQKRLEKGLAPLVVCCRSAEYLTLPTRVSLQRAVSIQPLTQAQINHYLQSAKGQLEELQHALHHDAELRKLIERPLMLSIFTLTYQNARAEALPIGGTSETYQHQIFATYVKGMFTRRALSKRFSYEQMREWLKFLAAGMRRHNQTMFYLEHMQPDWLGDWHSRLLYRLSIGLLIGLIFGLIGGLINGRIFGLINGLSAGLIFGLIFGLSQIQPREILTRSWRGTKRGVLIGLTYGLLTGLVHGLLVGLFAGLLAGLKHGLIAGLTSGLIAGLIFGLIVGLAYGLIAGLITALVAVLIASFSKSKLDNRLHLTPHQGIWRSARNGLFVELVVGLVVWLPTVLFFGSFTGPAATYFFGLISGPLAVGLIAMGVGLPTGMIAGLVAALTPEFSTSKLDDRLRLAPNQGMWRSAQNGLLSGLVAALIIVLPMVLLVGLPAALVVALPTALVIALPAALIVGLGAFFQHFALRFWLRCTNCLPWNLVAFLDEATERLLLRKVGGGYIFVHWLLLDYFAALASESTFSEDEREK